jgi:uncharacterized protein
MNLFHFDEERHFLGSAREIESSRIMLHVKSDDNLRKALVGQLAAVELMHSASWMIGMIDKVVKSASIANLSPTQEHAEVPTQQEEVANKILLTPVGSIRTSEAGRSITFSRSIDQVPVIDAKCYILKDAPLTAFFQLLAQEGQAEHALAFGKYSLASEATAYIDGNKLFQRHAALLGSTGSGKSWAVTSILEKTARLPSTNMVVFDLHGEYTNLSYVKTLHIPGPEELGSHDEQILYLPYWLLNSEELIAMFVDQSEYSAQNQVAIFQEKVLEAKTRYLTEQGKEALLKSFTLNSPVPFSIDEVISDITYLNEEMVAGSRGLRKGDYHGQFSRFLTRLHAKVKDRRYGFLFSAPETHHTYHAMAEIIHAMMDFSQENAKIKCIDFSEVPSDILSIIVGLTARIIYQIQFWTDPKERNPIALVCDEAHLYLPKKQGQNPAVQRAVGAFERIAKEGRKYGVSLVIVSQRPSDVSTTILSQCSNVITLRLTNGTDQATVRKLMPENFKNLLDVLPVMDIGEAMVIGDAVLLPSRIRIHEPEEKPLSATIDFWTEWQKESDGIQFSSAVENMRRQGRKRKESQGDPGVRRE